MDWEWAVKQMDKGRKVRRTCWFLNMFLKMTNSKWFSLFLQAGDREVDLGLGNNFTRTSRNKLLNRLLGSDRMVTDWELFEED